MVALETVGEVSQGLLRAPRRELFPESLFGACAPHERLANPGGGVRIDGLHAGDVECRLRLTQRLLVGVAREEDLRRADWDLSGVSIRGLLARGDERRGLLDLLQRLIGF